MEIIDLSSEGEDVVDLCSDGEDSTDLCSDSTSLCSDSEDDHEGYGARSKRFRPSLHSLSMTSNENSDEEPLVLEVDSGFLSNTHQASSFHRTAENRAGTGRMSKMANTDLRCRPVPSLNSVVDSEAGICLENLENILFTVDETAVYEEALQCIHQGKREEDLPDGVLSVPLLKLQKIALAWMVFRENSSHCKGGILADEQGLGKTISTIALIQKERLQQSRFMASDSEREISDNDDSEAVLVMDKKDLKAHASRSRAVKGRATKKTRVGSTASALRPASRPTAETLLDGEPIIKIPPKTIQLSKIDFTKEERAFYLRQLSSKVKGTFERLYIQKNYVHILALLSQLRQACNHPFLLRGNQPCNHSLALAKKLPVETAVNLVDSLERGAAKCTICNEPPKDTVASTCGHVFCAMCVHDKLINNIEVEEKVCSALPHCGKEISADTLLFANVLKFCLWPKPDSRATSCCSTDADQPFSVRESSYISSKIRATIDILKSIIGDAMRSVPAKAIVFTQWTGMLDLLERSLSSNHIIRVLKT